MNGLRRLAIAVLLLGAGVFAGSRISAPRNDTGWLIDRTQALAADGATFAFHLDAPATLEADVTAPAGWKATFGRILPSPQPALVFVTDGVKRIRDGDVRLVADHPGAYVIWVHPVPTAMGEAPSRVRVRIRRAR